MRKYSAILMLLLCASFAIRVNAWDAPYSERRVGEKIFVSAVAADAMDDTTMKIEANCASALLMEASTGKILIAENEYERRFPASVTKIMSLILVCEAIENGKLSLSEEIAATKEACSKGGSQIWLEEGEMMTVDDLLKATCVFSANDACTLLGEAVAGSDEAFTALMNERAAQLGMKDTHFENCTGLDDSAKEHLTTAYDIALMSRELLRHDIIKEYSTIYMDSLRGGKTQLVNTNKLVRTYKGITGLKTGTTDKAGCCISASAERDGLSLIAVVLGAPNSADRFSAAKNMLDWGFANYECYIPSLGDMQLPEVSVLRGKEKTLVPVADPFTPVVLARGQSKDVKIQLNVSGPVHAPVEAGQALGTIRFVLNDELLAEYELKADRYIKQSTPMDYFARIFGLR